MLLFDTGKVCHIHKYSPKNKCFFASFNNDRGFSLDDKTKDCVDRNTGGRVNCPFYSCVLDCQAFEQE